MCFKLGGVATILCYGTEKTFGIRLDKVLCVKNANLAQR